MTRRTFSEVPYTRADWTVLYCVARGQEAQPEDVVGAADWVAPLRSAWDGDVRPELARAIARGWHGASA